MTPESAKCIAANLNSLMCALLEDDHAGVLSGMCVPRANLFAICYDVLPIIAGQKAWPPIKRGDTWELNGKPVPFTDDELDPPDLEF